MCTEGEVERFGDSQTLILISVIAATMKFEQAVKAGRFRAIYITFNIFPVQIPPLRERREDFTIIGAHFLKRFEKMYDKQIQGVSEKPLTLCKSYGGLAYS